MRKLITIILLGFSAVKAQIPQPGPDTTAKHFLIVASIKNLQEVSAGNLALQKAMKPEVKAFSQMLVNDHRQAQQILLKLAKTAGIVLPPSAIGGIQPDLMLKKMSSNFDQLYVHNMVSGHRNTVEVFQNYATTGRNPAVKTFAQQMLPMLRHHLAEIKAIDEKMMAAEQ